MIDTLATFADQVTNVAREVGVEGKLGGQARVPGAAGTWRDLTDNVNQLAANLTTQVRAIADVATAVTKGDLTRSITVEALRRGGAPEGQHQRDDPQPQGHHAEEHRAGLAEDEPREVHAHAAGSARPRDRVSRLILSERAPGRGAAGAFYIADHTEAARPQLKLLASYAYKAQEIARARSARRGAGRPVRVEKQRILLTAAPRDYIRISSASARRPAQHRRAAGAVRRPGQGGHRARLVLRFSEIHQTFLDQLTESIGIVLNTIAANMRPSTC